MWGKHQGTKIMYGGVSLLLLADDLIILGPDDPSKINPMYNLDRGTA